MKHLIRMLGRLLLAASLILPALALAGDFSLKSEAFQDVVVKGKDGKPVKKRQAVTTAVPGSEVVYVISYRNSGSKPANDIVINNPVPAQMRFVAGSAEGAGTRIEMSVDGGKQFGALEALQVKGGDGKSRAARAEDVTNLRWTLLGAVAPGKDGNVSYRAVVR